MCDAWERFKELQRSCPYHGLPKDVLIHTFYNGVMRSTRDTIDAAACGSLMRKTIESAFELLEKMANNNCLWPSERHLAPRQGEKLGVDEVTSIQAQLAALSKKIDGFASRGNVISASCSAMYCEYCYMLDHTTLECGFGGENVYRDGTLENCSYVGNQFQPWQLLGFTGLKAQRKFKI